MTSPTTPCLKGQPLAEVLEWHSARIGPSATVAIIESIERADRHGLDATMPRFGIVASSWYPSTLVWRVTEEMTKRMTPAVRRTFARDASAFMVDRTIRGVYRLMFHALATPERYARGLQRAWNQLHNTGIRSIQFVGQRKMFSTTREWAGHHAILCELTAGTTRAVFERMGKLQVEVNRAGCVSSGAPECTTVITWNDP